MDNAQKHEKTKLEPEANTQKLMHKVTLSFESQEAAESLRSIIAKIKANDPSHKIPRLAISALARATVVSCGGCGIDIGTQLEHNAAK